MGKIRKDKNPDAKEIKARYGVTNDYYNVENIIENIGDDINTMRKVFEIFNEQLFEGQLEVPLIYIVPGLKVEYKVELPSGWMKVKGSKEEKDCIRLSMGEKLYKKELKDIYVALVEAMIMQYDLEMSMIHTYNGSKWIRLINNNNNYYGKRYRIECEARGLKILETEGVKEGKKPEVCAGDKFNEIYKNYNIEKYFALVHQYKPVEENSKSSNRQSMRKFICPGCKMKIRVTKIGDIDIRCYNNGCKGERFVPDPKDENKK